MKHARYDATGIRQSQSADGHTTRFLVDPNQAYAQVIEERDTDGDATAIYTVGDDRIAQQILDAQGGIDYHAYHADGLGSTRLLTDPAGEAVARLWYEAFGETEAQIGAADTAFRYTGEQLDPNLGWYYLRARYMDPARGRFTQMDPFAGFDQDPPSLHKYLYAHASPVNFIDPSGYFTLAGMSATTNVHSTLASLQAGFGFDLVGAALNSESYSASTVGWSVILSMLPGGVAKVGTVFGRVRFIKNERVGRGWVKANKGTRPEEIRSADFLADHLGVTIYARGRGQGADFYIAGRRWELKVLTTGSPSNAAEKVIHAIKRQGNSRVVVDVRGSTLGRRGVEEMYAEVLRKSARDGFRPPSEFMAILPDNAVIIKP